MILTCLISRTNNRPNQTARVELRPKSVLIQRSGKRLIIPVADITGTRLREVKQKEGLFRSRTWWVITILHHDEVGSGQHLLWFEDPEVADRVHDTLDRRLWNRAVVVNENDEQPRRYR